MDDLTTWLISVAWPVVKKVLTALGVGILSFTGLTNLFNSVRDNVITAWGGVGGAVLQIASIGGVPEALGIVLGAVAIRVVFSAMGKIGLIAQS